LIQATQVAMRRRALASIQARRNSIQATRTQTEQAITTLAGVLQALDAAERAGQHLTRLDRLQTISGAMANIHRQAQQQRQRIEQLQLTDEAVRAIDKAAKLAERKQQIVRIKAACQEIKRQEQSAREAVAENTMIADGAAKLYVLELRKLGKCPVCGGQISEQCIKEVL